MDGVTVCSHQAPSFTVSTQRPEGPQDGLEAGSPQSWTQAPRHWEGIPEKRRGSLVTTVLFLGVGGV